MNPIVFALRHPYTVMVAVVAVVLGSALAIARMKIDIFPSLNLPVIYVAQPYGGLDPAQMEGLITNYIRISLPLHLRHPPCRVAQHPRHGSDEAVFPSR